MSLIATDYQRYVQDLLADGKSVLLVAPCGTGKTYAVTGSPQGLLPSKLAYAVPLRALAGGISAELPEYATGEPNTPEVAVHHGGEASSRLFGERAIVTTYDQVVCASAGIPLSFSSRAGHAVAGGLQMSRLILDEAHLAFDISREALTILAAILEQRHKTGAQSVLATATLPVPAAEALAEVADMEVVVASEEEFPGDEALRERRLRRSVTLQKLEAPNPKKYPVAPALMERLVSEEGKVIYYANTVGRLQAAYDDLIEREVPKERITVLHNRMPASWRAEYEREALERFGKGSPDGQWILLTNQVSEAGLDISAPLVATDPAPVQTLVQRLGRCARFFRGGQVGGEFLVMVPAGAGKMLEHYSLPYEPNSVKQALEEMPEEGSELDWDAEREWVERGWPSSGEAKKSREENIRGYVEGHLSRTREALNLMDVAFTERSSGRLEYAFRDMVSVGVAVLSGETPEEALKKAEKRLHNGEVPEAASMSIKAASSLRFADGSSGYSHIHSRALRDVDGEHRIEKVGARLLPGDILLLPPGGPAHLDPAKGLVEGTSATGGLETPWTGRGRSSGPRGSASTTRSLNRYQSLSEHTLSVASGVERRLSVGGDYRDALESILYSLEPEVDPATLADYVAEMVVLCSLVHDIGKAGSLWQEGARLACEEYGEPAPSGELVGRTPGFHRRRLDPHTPPAFAASVSVCRKFLGGSVSPHLEEVVRILALATARHHSSFHSPSEPPEGYIFEPVAGTTDCISGLLTSRKLDVVSAGRVAAAVVEDSKHAPHSVDVPVIQPGGDLFALYALVGRAILMADREDAAGAPLEDIAPLAPIPAEARDEFAEGRLF